MNYKFMPKGIYKEIGDAYDAECERIRHDFISHKIEYPDYYHLMDVAFVDYSQKLKEALENEQKKNLS